MRGSPLEKSTCTRKCMWLKQVTKWYGVEDRKSQTIAYRAHPVREALQLPAAWQRCSCPISIGRSAILGDPGSVRGKVKGPLAAQGGSGIGDDLQHTQGYQKFKSIPEGNLERA
jgi:hypothetical protein